MERSWLLTKCLRVFLTNAKDIKNEFVKNRFLADYETMALDVMSDDVKKFKEEGNDNEYKKAQKAGEEHAGASDNRMEGIMA